MLVAIGVIITSVGLGDRGFKTFELQMLGPTLLGPGVMFVMLRILFCTIPCCGPPEDEVTKDETTSNTDDVHVGINPNPESDPQPMTQPQPILIETSFNYDSYVTSPISCLDLDGSVVNLTGKKIVLQSHFSDE